MYYFDFSVEFVDMLRISQDFVKGVGSAVYLQNELQNIESFVVDASHGQNFTLIRVCSFVGSIIELGYAISCYSYARYDDLGSLLSFQLLDAFVRMVQDLGLEIPSFPDKVQTAYYTVRIARLSERENGDLSTRPA